jgi:hypothetical protein
MQLNFAKIDEGQPPLFSQRGLTRSPQDANATLLSLSTSRNIVSKFAAS